MCIFQLPPTFHMSAIEKQNLWDELVKKNRVIFKEGDDVKTPVLRILDQYLRQNESQTFAQGMKFIPTHDEEFTRKRAEYKQAWDEFRAEQNKKKE